MTVCTCGQRILYSRRVKCVNCGSIIAKHQAANARHNRKYLTEPLHDLPDAVIDAQFEAALKEIRRSGVHRVEGETRDFRYRYQEPR